MDNAAKPIAVVQGADGWAVQALFERVVARLGVRIVGVIEQAGAAGSGDKTGWLQTIGSAQRFAMFQALGSGAGGCSLLASGVVAAGEQVRRDMAAGCDLVVLNKFGRLEAEERSGLIDVFGAAIEAGVPVLTSVSPRFAADWDRFAEPLYGWVPPRDDAVLDWWSALMDAGVA